MCSGGGLCRSIRSGLAPKKVVAALLFSIIGANVYAQSTTGLSDTINELDDIDVFPPNTYEHFEGHYEQGAGWEWEQFDTDSSSGTYGQTVPVEPPPPELTCPEVAEKMAELDCPNHPFSGPNGCGRAGWAGMLIPQTIPGTPINAVPACDAHDTCYGSLGSNKENCDEQLGADIRAQCGTAGGQQIIRDTCNVDIAAGTNTLSVPDCIINSTQICEGTGYIYQGAVQAYGFDGFYNAQIVAACAALLDLKNANACP
jgi:hypothetical protein